DLRAGHEHDRRRGDLRTELRERAEAVEVVEEAGDDALRAAGVDADERTRRHERARRGGEREAGAEPGEDPEPAEERRRGIVPAVARGARDEHRGETRGAAE